MKRRLILSFTAALSLLLIFSGCEEEPVKCTDPPCNVAYKTVTFTSQITLNGQDVFEGDVISLENNYDMNIDLFRFYISNVKFVNVDNDTIDVAYAELVDPGSRLDDKRFTADVPEGEYKLMLFGFGLDPVQNNADPGNFPNEHPLSDYQSMYWTMLKYRFAKFEGKVNTPGQLGQNDMLVSLHPGTDAMYRTGAYAIDMDMTTALSGEINIDIDMNTFFAGSDPFNWNTERSTHSEGSEQLAIAAKFMDKLKAATSVSGTVAVE